MAGTLNEPNRRATGGLPMNELREGEGREKDSAKETLLPRERQRGTTKPQPLLNQHEAAAESLRHRFLEADNKFYFRGPGEADKVAFADHGRRLTTEHEDPTVIHGMLLLAQAKGWTSLHVKGSDAFKAEAWMSATMAGIEVQGYHPREIDRVRREERKGETSIKQPRRRVEPVAPRDPSTSRRDKEPDSLTAAQNLAIATLHTILRERGDSAAMIAAAVEEARARLQGERLVVGTIVEHGKARYGHGEQAEQSYVVKVATARGEKEVWGVDLARAMERSGAKPGDAVALIQRAHERVTVQSPVKNEAGEVVGLAPQPAKRNKWEVLNLQTIGTEARDRLTAAARVATHEPVVQVFDPAAARTDQIPDMARIRDQERTRAGR
jgi:Large polyvalent protein-associated domain 7